MSENLCIQWKLAQIHRAGGPGFGEAPINFFSSFVIVETDY